MTERNHGALWVIACKEARMSRSRRNADFAASRGSSNHWIHHDVHAWDRTKLRPNLTRDDREAAGLPPYAVES